MNKNNVDEQNFFLYNSTTKASVDAHIIQRT